MVYKQGRHQGVQLGVANCFDAAPPSQRECAASPEKVTQHAGAGDSNTFFFDLKKVVPKFT